MSQEVADVSDVQYRSVLPSDFSGIKYLHDEFFPVKYSDEFFKHTCEGVGINGGKLFSSLAVARTGDIVGFVFAQLFAYPYQSEDKDLFSFEGQPGSVCYIITLGVVPQARKYGLGSILIKHCTDYARCDANCGAVR
jgi:ribosomal protein S18 acetylase RimI-like enzyme